MGPSARSWRDHFCWPLPSRSSGCAARILPEAWEAENDASRTPPARAQAYAPPRLEAHPDPTDRRGDWKKRGSR
jgi:hypothetical protein